jgi:hypothetical protein
MDLQAAMGFLAELQVGGFRSRVQRLELDAVRANLSNIEGRLASFKITDATLAAALQVKRAVGEINVIIHSIGILLALPLILEPGEEVEYVSLGAGNTGRAFDLETNLRVAEFKFISWRGGPEAIRQNSIFKDFFYLANHETTKRKELYVVGDLHPMRFFHGGRAMSSVTKEKKLAIDFNNRFADQYRTVREYFAAHRHLVQIRDLEKLAPGLFGQIAEVEEVQSGLGEIS